MFSGGVPHDYKDVWIPIIGENSLTCERKEFNENDKNAVTIIWDDCVSKKTVGHGRQNWSKLASTFMHVFSFFLTNQRVFAINR